MSTDRHPNINIAGFAIHVTQALEQNLRDKNNIKVIFDNDETRNLIIEFAEELESLIDSKIGNL